MHIVFTLWVFFYGYGSANIGTFATDSLCQKSGQQIMKKSPEGIPSFFMCITKEQPKLY